MSIAAGTKFNRLTAVRFHEWHWFPRGKRQPKWQFVCDCGNTVVALVSNVKSGHTQSCGCFQAQRRIEAHTKHGGCNHSHDVKSYEPLYRVWLGMMKRCHGSPEDPNFKKYGARGIKILWKSYEDFRRDMLPGWKPGLQIDRINNDGHYHKENCRWATPQQQSLNRRTNIRLTLNGETLCASQWSERLGIKRQTIENRFHAGWDQEKILTQPLKAAKTFTHEGKTMSLQDWGRHLGVQWKTLWARMKSGWTNERTFTP